MEIQSALRITAAVTLLCTAAKSHGQTLFQSNLDSNAGWGIFQEATNPSSLATFGYDYSALGIPPSPNGGGSTLGLRLAANAAAPGSIQAITAATTLTFSGQFRVTFDFWGNTNGPLPGGGTGSTEYLGGGVGFSGTLPRRGASAITTMEGGAALDWRLDKKCGLASIGDRIL